MKVGILRYKFTTNYFNSNVKCNNLSDHINDTQYIGDPKDFVLV